MTFNIHAGTSTQRFHHYFTHSWRQVLPHTQRTENLDAIAGLVAGYDLVGLQESDVGSLRSGFLNQTRYIARHADMPFWTHQSNRKVGTVSQTGNGILGRFEPHDIEHHQLPGAIPGRGSLVLRYGDINGLVVAVVHLALSRRARGQQLDYLARLLSASQHLVIMGDFNTETDNAQIQAFCAALGLATPTAGLASFPAWQPQRAIDHILVSQHLNSYDARVIDVPMSDHCPITLTVDLPQGSLTRPTRRATQTADAD